MVDRAAAGTEPVVYFDLGSPYAYLALERAPGLLGTDVRYVPVLLGALFRLRGRGSWAETAERAAGIAEVERRARTYGLPPVLWPAVWPTDGLAAMRAATWAVSKGRGLGFAQAVLRAQFRGGADITDLALLSSCAREAGLGGDALPAAIVAPEVKAALRAATDRAWADGVSGVPSVAVRGQVFFGDDRLQDAAACLGYPES